MKIILFLEKSRKEEILVTIFLDYLPVNNPKFGKFLLPKDSQKTSCFSKPVKSNSQKKPLEVFCKKRCS